MIDGYLFVLIAFIVCVIAFGVAWLGTTIIKHNFEKYDTITQVKKLKEKK